MWLAAIRDADILHGGDAVAADDAGGIAVEVVAVHLAVVVPVAAAGVGIVTVGELVEGVVGVAHMHFALLGGRRWRW